MDKIIEEMQKMQEINLENQIKEETKNKIKQSENELSILAEKVQLKMIGTYDREVAQKTYDEKNTELEEDRKQYEEKNEELNEKFVEQKNKIMEEIDSEMSLYLKTKEQKEQKEKEQEEELMQLESEKNAYKKIAENYKKDIDKMLEKLNNGEITDQSRLGNARIEYKANIEKVKTTEKEIEEFKESYKEYKLLEENQESYMDLEYLKSRITGLNFDNLQKLEEDEFLVKYAQKQEEKDETENNIDEEENDKDEEKNPNSEPNTKPEQNPKPNPNSNQNPKPEPKPNPSQTKIILKIDENKIKIGEKDELFYKKQLKDKKQIVEEYGINSYFINDEKAKKNIDYALLSTLKKIDDKDNTLVMSYLNVIRGGGMSGKTLEESMKSLKDVVNIEYKFDKESSILKNLKAKRIARNAKKIGIASLDGISEKSVWDNTKEFFAKFKNIKTLKKPENVKTLQTGEKTNAEKNIEKVKDLIKEDKNGTKEFNKDYEVDDKIKQAVDEVVEKYKKEEKEAEKNRSKDVEEIKENKIHKLTPDEYEEIKPTKSDYSR